MTQEEIDKEKADLFEKLLNYLFITPELKNQFRIQWNNITLKQKQNDKEKS